MKLAVFSFFSCAGFLDLGFHDAGFDVVYVNEYHKPFLDAYRHSRKHCFRHPDPLLGYSGDDFTHLRVSSFRNAIEELKKGYDYVGFIAGPPCPDFSVAGKSAGHTGQNGRLTTAYFEFIHECQPDFFLFENVKGLTTAKHYPQYLELKAKLDGQYYLFDSVVNALTYGVPQNRERLICLGFNKAIAPDLTPVNFGKRQKYTMSEIKACQWPTVDIFGQQDLPQPANIIRDLTIQHWWEQNNVTVHPNHTNRVNHGSPLPSYYHTIAEGDISSNCQTKQRLHRWRCSNTVMASRAPHLHPYKTRRLSIAERLAIQSLPKNFQLPTDLPLKDLMAITGNGVPYLMAKGLAETIKDNLDNVTSGDYTGV